MSRHRETSDQDGEPSSFQRKGRGDSHRAERPPPRKRRRNRRSLPSLRTESLEQRLLPTAAPVAALVAPDWFEDVSSPATPLHSGTAGWSAESSGQQASSASGSQSNTYDWIVRFNASASAAVSSVADTASLLVGSGVEFQVLRGLGLVGQVLVRSTGASADMVQSILTSNHNVASFERDAVRQFNTVPNDPQLANMWGLENSGQNSGLSDADIDAAAAWGISTGSRNVVVAVVDTGVDWRHSDLAANIWTNSGEVAGNGVDDDGDGLVDDVHGYNFAANTGDPMDDNGHGTHVAGTIAAVGNNGLGVSGVNWSASIMALKFLRADGSGYTSDAVRAINYATLERSRYGVNVRVINMSWGGGGYSSALGTAIQAAGDAGILCVAAAGNEGSNNDASARYPSNYPATNLVSVAATDKRDALASFSNYGATTVDLAAPGVSILSTYTNNRYVSLSGTSMATPHVAGVAALAWSVAPNATVAEIKNALLGGVDRLAGLSGKVASGGRLNAYNTLRLLNVRTPQAPEIASLDVSAASLTAGSPATLTARGVTDPDGSVSGVSFYRDSNNNGQWDASDLVLGSTSAVSGQQASFALNTAGYSPGTYRVFARAQDSSGLWSTAVATAFQVVAADDYGNAAATASTIGVGSTLSGKIDTGGDHDWFKFTAVAGRKYTIATQLRTLQDSVLTLYGPSGANPLATNDDAPGRGLASQIDWTASVGGTYYVDVKAYSATQTGAYSLAISATAANAAPVLAQPGDRTMSAGQGSIVVALSAVDVDGDRLSYAAEVLPSNASNSQAYELDQRLGLYSTGNYMQGLLGAGEKWMRGSGSRAYYIQPNGELHQWAGSMATSPLVATLGAEYWANPSLLHDAQPGSQTFSPSDVNLGLQGSVLTISPRGGKLGQFQIRVTASDGAHRDSKTFTVTVTGASASAAAVEVQSEARTLLSRTIDEIIGAASLAGQGEWREAAAWHRLSTDPVDQSDAQAVRAGLSPQPSAGASSPSQAGALRSTVLTQFLDEQRADGQQRLELANRMLEELSALLAEANLPAPETVTG